MLKGVGVKSITIFVTTHRFWHRNHTNALKLTCLVDSNASLSLCGLLCSYRDSEQSSGMVLSAEPSSDTVHL